MAIKPKLKDDSSKVITAVLLAALEDCRQGDVELAEELGLTIDTIQKLDNLKPDQVCDISSIYMKGISTLDLIHIDTHKISNIIELEAKKNELYNMIDEFIRRGACKTVMKELFGMRSTQVANRKKFINVPTIKGRLKEITLDEKKQIYDSWLNSIKTSDFRERLLYVAKATNLAMSKIYRSVLEIEEIENTQSLFKEKKFYAIGGNHG